MLPVPNYCPLKSKTKDGQGTPVATGSIASISSDGRLIRVPWIKKDFNILTNLRHKIGNYPIQFFLSLCEASSFSPEQRAKIKNMSQKDVDIKERRVWYNALARRMSNPQGLPPGLVQKYISCNGNNKKRWELVRAFMLDEDMNLGCTMQCAILCKQSTMSICKTKSPTHALHWPGRMLKSKHGLCSLILGVSKFCTQRVNSTFGLRNTQGIRTQG